MKKTGKKIVSSIVAGALAISMGVGIVGCSGGSSASSASSSAATEANVAIDLSKVGSDSTPIRLGMTKGNPNPVAVINALQEGYFQDENANVDVTIIEDMATAYSSVANNDLDMVVAMNLALNRIAEGEENLYMVGGIMSSGGVLEVAPDSPIQELKTADDFRGLTLTGIPADSEVVVLEAYLLENGLERDKDYKMVYTEDMSVNAENVLKGNADVAIFNGVPAYMVGVRSGLRVVGYDEDLVGMYPCCRVTVNEEMTTTNKYALVQFLIAELRGYQLFKEDKATTVKNLAEFTGIDEESLEAIYYGIPEYKTSMEIVMDPQVDLIKDYYQDYKTDGFIDPDTPYEPDDYFYNEAYLAALDILSEREPNAQLWKDMKAEYEQWNTTYEAK